MQEAMHSEPEKNAIQEKFIFILFFRIIAMSILIYCKWIQSAIVGPLIIHLMPNESWDWRLNFYLKLQ